ncbi:MAG TPA: DUF1064 domain-containing protein [Reyranella sp.]|nr:DUF1064 domain-containing protein [Reyranella sp.]
MTFGKRTFARGRTQRPKHGAMNKMEASYGELLEQRRIRGEVASYAFEAVKLKLAPLTFYTPDYRVILVDGTEEYHEVKGFWEDDARVKIKTAAVIHDCYVFRSVTRDRKTKGWKIEEVPAV